MLQAADIDAPGRCNANGATEDADAAPEAADDIVTLAEAARLLDTSVPTLKSWIEDRGFPVLRKGKNGVGYEISLRAAYLWQVEDEGRQSAELERRRAAQRQLRIEFLGPDALSARSAEAAGGLSPRQQIEAADAERKLVELARAKRELLVRDDVRIEFARVAKLLGDRLDAFGDLLGARLGWDAETRQQCEEAVGDLRDELADELAAIDPDAAGNDAA